MGRLGGVDRVASPHGGQLPGILDWQLGLPLTDAQYFMGTQNPEVRGESRIERVPDVLLYTEVAAPSFGR